MIAFGSSITKPEVYRECAQRGIERVAEPDSEVFALPSIGPIFASYNRVLEQAAAIRRPRGARAPAPGHRDRRSAVLRGRPRSAGRSQRRGRSGCVGAVDVRSIAWWEGSVSQASFVHRYAEHGGGDLPGFSWDWTHAPPYARPGEVDTIDGFLMVLSPWVVRNIRFDESLGQLHGYDLDFCLQVREAGRRVLTADCAAPSTLIR